MNDSQVIPLHNDKRKKKHNYMQKNSGNNYQNKKKKIFHPCFFLSFDLLKAYQSEKGYFQFVLKLDIDILANQITLDSSNAVHIILVTK